MKIYIEPEVEIFPISIVSALCKSGDDSDNSGLGGNGGGGDPWNDGRSPKRVFF